MTTGLDTGLGGWRRTHTLGELTAAHAGQTTTLMGWVHRRRDHGNLIFLDLRDRFGMTQVVLDPAVDAKAHATGNELRSEFVVAIRGKVIKRPDGMVNANMATGAIEIHATELKILGRAEVLPFPVNQDEKTEATETLRLKHRYLDLRRPAIRDKIMGRIKFVKAMRAALEKEGFLDIETPFLYKSTPEGAREFLVPSRVHPGQFYALPQSPQLFKQVLMMSGFDRYYQVVKCFRDEDLRADRQPEFTQVDCELSFVEQEQLLETFERVITTAVTEFTGKQLKSPIPRKTFAEVMEDYGVDKPDLRFGLKLKNVTEIVAGCGFKVFAEAASMGGIVNAIVLPGLAEAYSRKEIDDLTEVAKTCGLKGLAWAKRKAGNGVDSWQSSIGKFFTPDLIDKINAHVGANDGDLILFGAGPYDATKAGLGALRNHLGGKHGMRTPDELNFLWVVDFPLLERDVENNRWIARHHPFTMPNPADLPLLDKDPGAVRACAYDLVLNGYEVAGGSVRIHDTKLQMQQFARLGLSEHDARQKFGFLLDALSYGAPPHGGIAFGLDRMVMCLLGTDAIRDVIPFPKTQKATDLMTESPSPVPEQSLRDLHIRVHIPTVGTPGATKDNA
jgi:aspartyl-tRNA synthetase